MISTTAKIWFNHTKSSLTTRHLVPQLK